MNDNQLFAFEDDFVAALRCIPMAVRLKLDRSGIKLTLRQWSRFTRSDRQILLDAPCRTFEEISEYRAWLTVDWFFAPHLELRTDLVVREGDRGELLQVQLHMYL